MDLLVWINIYGIYLAIAFVPCTYYIWLRIFSFPLITRKPQELLLMLTPEKVTIKKVKSRELPFFKLRKGLYWFSEPFQDIDSNNKFHVFIEGLNQALTETERRENKVDELITYTEKINSLSNHKILFPKNIKAHMHRHYMITLEPHTKLLKLTPVDERQNHRYSFVHSIGFQIQEQNLNEDQTQDIESESSSGNLVFTQLTTQSILKKIKFIQEYNYFSSFSAYQLSKKIKRMNRNFVMWLLGSFDVRILILLIAVFGSIAMIIFGMPLLTPDIGPMPTQ